MKKFLLLTLEYPPFYGGVANYYGNLVKYWPDPNNIFILNNNENKLINKNLPFLKWLPAIFALKRRIKKLNINHVIVGQILPLGITTYICRRFYKIEYSVILHGMDFTYAIKFWRKKIITNIILKKAVKIICTNSYTASLVKNFLGPAYENKIITVNPGVENAIIDNNKLIAQLKTKYNLENKIILLSVGRLIKRKGFDKVIACLPKVLLKVPNLLYVILGNGEEIGNPPGRMSVRTGWKLEIGNLGLKEHIKIISQATDEERNSWYNISDIFIMPAREIKGDFEGFGIVYLEANLAGKPVIAGRSGGVADAVIDGFNGLLINPDSLDDIAGAIIKLALNPGLRQKLERQGRERALNDFNWPKQIKIIYDVLKK